MAPAKATGRPPFGHETMLRLHFLQQWFGLSDFAMKEALFDIPLYRAFAGLGNTDRLPDHVSILRSVICSSSMVWSSRCWPRSTPP